MAKSFAHLYAGDYRHVNGLGWYKWADYRWEPGEHETVVWAAGDMAESLAHTDPTGLHTDAELRRERRRAMPTSGIKSMSPTSSSAKRAPASSPGSSTVPGATSQGKRS
ncbi:hypothetical protein [Streptomyces decoyicus]|uniref:hypothetical protein n=1 Tax=Streptomyces decoyicus TaxID=249567 RepID=UPI00380B94C8